MKQRLRQVGPGMDENQLLQTSPGWDRDIRFVTCCVVKQAMMSAMG
jgi:hypothetical protein